MDNILKASSFSESDSLRSLQELSLIAQTAGYDVDLDFSSFFLQVWESLRQVDWKNQVGIVALRRAGGNLRAFLIAT